MTTQAAFWTGAAASLVLAMFAGVMERRRNRRQEYDEVGWMPWRGIQVAGFFAALACAILALHA